MQLTKEIKVLRQIIMALTVLVGLFTALPFILNYFLVRFQVTNAWSDLFFFGLSYKYALLQLTVIATYLLLHFLLRYCPQRLVNLILLFSLLLFLFALDRLLYTWRPSLWQYDPQIFYRHVPNLTHNWGPKNGYKPIYINQYGYHDVDFPLEKSPAEQRIVVLGDSLTMASAMTIPETYPKRLEGVLNSQIQQHYRVINTGVQGYGAAQEYVMMQEARRFQPDLYILGFCMNDITEPFRADKNLGGTGRFFNINQKRSRLYNVLLTKTGFGTLLNEIKKTPARQDKELLAKASNYNVRLLIRDFNQPRMSAAFNLYLKQLDKIIDFANNNQVPLLVLIFPHTFQVEDQNLRVVQQKLGQYLAGRDVDYLDFTGVWADTLRVGQPLPKYFLDDCHLTAAGHTLVAAEIYRKLILRP